MTISTRLAVDSTRYSSPELLQLLTREFLKFKKQRKDSAFCPMRTRRVLVFVDESNVVSSVRAIGRKLDWLKLRDYLANADEGRELIEMVIYAGLPPAMPEWQSELREEEQVPALASLERISRRDERWLSGGWQALQSERGRVDGDRRG